MKRLLTYFSDPVSIFHATAKELISCGISQRAVENFQTRKRLVSLEKIEKYLAQSSCKILLFGETNYPKLLTQIPDPPFLLYTKGNISLLGKKCVAVVGSRSASEYGKLAVKQLVPQLIPADICIVSGLAVGIDALSHQATLDTKGKTIAVLGSGIEHIFPSQNQSLADNILNNDGLIISELPPFFHSSKFTFPLRNRIIAGISTAVVVVEAMEKSGALITAECALESGREVFAVPGNINQPRSLGCNQLIQKGAHIITSVKDIFDVLGIPRQLQTISQNENEALILSLFQNYDEISIDYLTAQIHLPINMINATLIEMELSGKITKLPSGKYSRNL